MTTAQFTFTFLPTPFDRQLKKLIIEDVSIKAQNGLFLSWRHFISAVGEQPPSLRNGLHFFSPKRETSISWDSV